MGDIGTHAEITEFVTAQVGAAVSPTEIPVADYTYLELGNFLTDVAQFRDPVAFHGAREAARAKLPGPAQNWYGPDWLIAMFGRHSGPVHGALPEFLRMLMQAFAHEVFDDDALPVLGAALGLLPGGRRPALIPAHGLPHTRVDDMLRAHFTQYFPHEHLDFPPEPDLVRHRTKPMFRTAGRGLIAYLEWYLQYVSEELSKLEQEWLRARAAGLRPPARQDLLSRLGHLLHAVEDYFFHSNLVELFQWAEVRSLHPAASPTVPADLRVLIDDSLNGTGLSATSVPLRRHLFRRIRYPVYDTQTQLSATASDDGTALVFTGGFGPTDVFHTLGGALEAIESKIALLPASHDPRRTSVVMFRLMLSADARRDMVTANSSEAMWKRHREQLRNGDITREIASWETRGLLCPHAAAELRAAFAHDLRVTNAQAGTIFDFPGPAGVLILMLEQMQAERDRADLAKVRLDGIATSPYDVGTANGCSSENVGTHSLMSKDSTDKEPMRPHAVALAKHASASVALLFLTRVTGPALITEGLDWDTLLRFFVRGAPNGPTNGPWESELFQRLRAGGFSQPAVTAVSQQPNFGLLGPSAGAAKLAARRTGTTKADLEAFYRRFESDP